MQDDQRPADPPRAAIPLAPLPTGTALVDEIAAILGAGVARVVEANAIKDAEQAVASAPCMELAINRGSRLTVRPADRECGERAKENGHESDD